MWGDASDLQTLEVCTANIYAPARSMLPQSPSALGRVVQSPTSSASPLDRVLQAHVSVHQAVHAESGFPAVDRALFQGLRAQLAAAHERSRAQWDATQEITRHARAMESELEEERVESARLREDMRRLTHKHREEVRCSTSLRRAVQDLELEVAALKAQRDHWLAGCHQAEAARDTAVCAAHGLREALREAPTGSGESAELLRAQLIATRHRKAEHRARATTEANRAESLALRTEAMERETWELRQQLQDQLTLQQHLRDEMVRRDATR